jgi:organic hydroperoxide reductase OsmC/OhrA
MSEYLVEIRWERQGAAFVDNRYSRGHQWVFDGGVCVPASSSPQVVPLPYSAAAAVDPEEAFVAALSSCHMLWFLSLAAGRGLVVDRYRDTAVGVLGRDAAGKLAMLDVTLRPLVTFGGDTSPAGAELAALHQAAHAECFIANSVKTRVHCTPVPSSEALP